MTASFVDLPVEIIDNVLSFLNVQDLLSIDRCSQLLHSLATKHLYKSITFDQVQPIPLFLRSLVGNAKARMSVQELYFKGEVTATTLHEFVTSMHAWNYDPSGTLQSAPLWAFLHPFLNDASSRFTSLPNLQTLFFPAWKFQEKLCFPKLRRLSVFIENIIDVTDIQLPRLEYLRILFADFESEVSSVETFGEKLKSSRSYLNLETIDFEHYNFGIPYFETKSSTLCHAFLRGLLSGHSKELPRLKCLKVDCRADLSELRALLRICGKTLERTSKVETRFVPMIENADVMVKNSSH